ncbi:hypothetical protein WKI65_31040 [Streptomyces sp. MS1.AVA.3]|uniref:hypothetical protein n=1 Tax=Streptomyces decoyicus TaxID=249567 RepID=UPI0030C4B92F
MNPSRKIDLAAALDRKNAARNRRPNRLERGLPPTAGRGGQFRPTNAPRRHSY